MVTAVLAPDLAAQAAACLLLDPAGFGGVVLNGPADAARTAWLTAVRAALPDGTPWQRIPAGITDDRLLGGLDLAATLATGRPVAERGVLAQADGGCCVLPMAERAARQVSGALAAALDEGVVRVQRDGLALEHPARIAVIALDEHEGEEAPLATALAARLAFHVSVPADWAEAPADLPSPVQLPALQAAFRALEPTTAVLRALDGAAQAFGVRDLRAVRFAVRAAAALAVLDGRGVVDDDDLAAAVRLVLVPRATQLPAPPPPDSEAPPSPPDPTPPDGDAAEQTDTPAEGRLEDQVVEAVMAALPPELLASIGSRRSQSRGGEAGRTGQLAKATARGRQVGTLPGLPRGGKRLDLLATLRAAAPWQRLRGAVPGRVAVRAEDLRLRRLKQRIGTTILFAVDASGSQAISRLGEAKGAVELLLAESYVRRDRVALLVFRGTTCELVLPPTRSLARAKRTLAGLPGGGGTPLATAIDTAATLALRIRREGGRPMVVFLTDGRANVARDGSGGRPKAEADAAQAARLFAGTGVPALVVDASARPNPSLAALAASMGARYLPLPVVRADQLGAAVRQIAVQEHG